MSDRADAPLPLVERLKQLQADELFDLVRRVAATRGLSPDDLFIQAAIDGRLDEEERQFFKEMMADPAWARRYDQLTEPRSLHGSDNQLP